MNSKFTKNENKIESKLKVIKSPNWLMGSVVGIEFALKAPNLEFRRKTEKI
ncbi:hypothetical protein LEP1GSC173_3938 [Leptospira interrogans str. HAI1594]|uniref:Uncharacterized protein n=1 Tax=Leptospira interrogans serovar Icterohaemorrhagiae str. Verdun HP TaxID=1049910 RepID=M6RS06_LEPIR|nr:hypothetical protein LEP1GSC117_1052 [Leptospira interrogans serovar Icterohaemorrhagiae str. Verdun LP]EKP74140.1 hypothetical protein LEP1GSC173_3938 [Leptospira interrogans str. HAI1594]EMO07339.1 hypothetical protein LEP1GSC116_4716 [Leptospira interrogans serovar Icterohaemorrhagiae str. Verdun HP]EMO18073.1 hypothetical protein LEP1GSC167_3679 [Leptospira interrogans serovar Copenhageni str. HAI0188]EMO36624.1 hypothetical protein LEP1GSC177_2593 [Leptospira interrogans str. MMD3731]E